jgi:uncharacterized repeat protein (TIGR01451 family)
MNKIYKSVLSVSATAVLLAATLTPMIVNARGDSANGRKIYTIEQINNGDLGDTITFNSISNGKIGDEEDFVGARMAGDTSSVLQNASIDVKDGDIITIRLYVHNNNPKGEKAIAEGVKASFLVPSGIAKSHTIIGYLDSSNATPNRYWDEVILNSSEDIYLNYVKGSAKFTNSKMGTVALPDEIVASGATLGYDKLDGKIPGCYQYDGFVTIDVKVHNYVAAKVSKQVRIKGTNTWSESVNAKVGDEVEFQIEFTNLLSETVRNVAIKDVLPANIEYVNGSTYLYNAGHPSGVLLEGDHLTENGIIIGDYGSNRNGIVRFTGKVVDKSLACGNNQLVNWANATISSSSLQNVVYKDDASVMVKKDDETCKKTPDPDPTPDPEPTPDPDGPTPTPTPDDPIDPGTPTVIVSTGPETIVTGAIGAGSVVTTLGYYIASRKKLM